METVTCPICNNKTRPIDNRISNFVCRKQTDKDTALSNYTCLYCGEFNMHEELSLTSTDQLKQKYRQSLYKLSSYIREQNKLWEIIPLMTEDKIEKVLTSNDKTLQEQFNLLIKNLSTFIRKINNINDLEVDLLMIDSWVQKDNMYDYYVLGKLFEKAYKMELLIAEGSYSYSLPLKYKVPIKKVKDFTIKGLEYLESIDQKNKNSNKIFLAFKFEQNKKVFEEVKRFIENDMEDIKFQAVIVNQDTTEHNEKISDKIIAELKGARMIIADFSAHSPNVYFEAGYAMGMNIPVIWTCDKEHIKDIAFDVNHFPMIEWKNVDDLKEKLKNRILRLI